MACWLAENRYDVGAELVVFSSRAELMERIDYFLAHEEERQAVAFADCGELYAIIRI